MVFFLYIRSGKTLAIQSRDKCLGICLNRTQYLLEFKYDEQKREFSFEKRLDLGKSIDAFTRLYDNFYLFAFLHESSFAFKKLVNHEVILFQIESV